MPCALVTAMVLIYALWPEPKIPPTPPLPSPNGYDDFVKAGTLLAAIDSDWRDLPFEELKTHVSTNQEPLKLVRLGLTRECAVPTEESTTYWQAHVPEMTSILSLSQLLAAEARLAETAGSFDDAARIYLETCRFGQASGRGGLIVDKLVGVAVEGIGTEGLSRIATELSMSSCKIIVSAIEQIDASFEPAVAYTKRNRDWSRKTTGWWDHLQFMWMAKSLFPTRQSDQRFSARLLKTIHNRRQLILTLASRAYELEHGKPPSRAEDLVPSVLRAIPKDPESGTSLVLHPTP